jgi:circadian clock protein KaiC
LGKNRVGTGVPGLDEMLGGGLHPGSVAVVKGPPGNGKTTIGLQFINHGVKMGGNGLFVTFEHFPVQLYRDANSLGINLKKHVDEGKVKIVFTSPEAFQSFLMEVDGEFDSMVAKHNISRVFIDSINHIERISAESWKLRELIYAFFNGLRRHDLVTLVAQEDQVLTGGLSLAPYGLSYMVDTLIQLRFVEIESHIEKAIVIIKHRASSHDNRIRRLVIDSKGARVEKEFKGLEGILSGSSHVASPLKESFKMAKKLFES